MTGRWAMVAGALAALVGVALGAFGAHALSGVLGPERLATWETAVRYQLVHALGLLAIAAFAAQRSSSWLRGAAACLVAGVIVFSGSLYLLCLTGAEWLGAITPIGGVVWIVGWALVAVHGLRGPGESRLG